MKHYKPALYKVHMTDDLLLCFRIDEKWVKISLSEKGYFSGNGRGEKRAV